MADMLVQEGRRELCTNIKLMCIIYLDMGHRSLYRGMKTHLITKERLQPSYEYLTLTTLVSTFNSLVYVFNLFLSMFHLIIYLYFFRNYSLYIVYGMLLSHRGLFCVLFKKWYVKFYYHFNINLQTHTCHQRLQAVSVLHTNRNPV